MFCLLLAGVCAQAQTTVRVLDYNIHRDIGGSDSNVSSQSALAKVVNYLAPDVWTINELGGNNAAFNATTAHNDLATFVKQDLTIFGTSPVEGVNFFIYVGALTDGYIANAIVSRYPILSSQTYSDATPGFNSLRGLTMALIDVPGAIDLGIFTAHLKALNSDANAEKRQGEADVDSANVASWMSAHPNAATVLTGDFNETEEPGETANWSGHQIGNPLPNNGEAYHPVTTMRSAHLNAVAAVSIAGNKDTIDSSSPNARFDYALFDPNHAQVLNSQVFDTKQYSSSQLAALNSASGASFVAGDSAFASDHLPVFATFQLVPEPSVVTLLGLACCGWWLILRVRRRRIRLDAPGRSG